VKILLELRPALDGHAGIPHETRQLFRGLSSLQGVEVEGLLQSSTRVLARGLPAHNAGSLSPDRRVHRLARVVVSLGTADKGIAARALAAARFNIKCALTILATLLGRRLPLGRFDATYFKDFIWRTLFSRSLPHEDFERVTAAGFRVAQVPWQGLHFSAMVTRRLGHALYPRLATAGYDVMLAETPYPGRVAAPTALVVRYHDAIPMLMPHTIENNSFHQASHYHALRRNVLDGAWFACVSESTRRDLLSIFPQAEARAVTIPNMVSAQFFAEESSAARVVDVLMTRGNRRIEKRASGTGVRAAGQAAPRLDAPPQYLLMVSTLEPRKNHLTLLAAWEQLRSAGHPNLHLVLVGTPGWNNREIVARLLPWVERGWVHVLHEVPASELRLLYRHALVTVCPSFGEGFDFSGVEAMRCGGIVAASDIPVHREIYDDAADYFNAYSAASLTHCLQALAGEDAQDRRTELVARGESVSARYLPENILPLWQDFLETLRIHTRIVS
jgi:hypothetical protein